VGETLVHSTLRVKVSHANSTSHMGSGLIWLRVAYDDLLVFPSVYGFLWVLPRHLSTIASRLIRWLLGDKHGYFVVSSI